MLALTAPRALCVVNATKDGIQFSVGEAKKSLALTAPVYKLLGKPENLQHAIFEGPHDYSKSMRETMYGFMTLHLKGEGKGDPIPEVAFKTEDPEALRCYPGDTRPKDFMTIPKFAAEEAKKLLAARPRPSRILDVNDTAILLNAARKRLETLCRVPGDNDHSLVPADRLATPNVPDFVLRYKAGIELPVYVEPGESKTTVVLLNLDGAAAARKSELFAALKKSGVRIVTVDLHATGTLATGSERVGRARTTTRRSGDFGWVRRCSPSGRRRPVTSVTSWREPTAAT